MTTLYWIILGWFVVGAVAAMAFGKFARQFDSPQFEEVEPSTGDGHKALPSRRLTSSTSR